MKIEGIEDASIEDLKRLLDYHKDQVDYWFNKDDAAGFILKHENEILEAIETELDKRLIGQDLWNDGDTDPAGGYGLSSHV